jgi:hypothetical protein
MLAEPVVTDAEQTKFPEPGIVKNSFPIVEIGYRRYRPAYS